MTDEDRDYQLEQYRKLRYLLDIHKVQRQHVASLKNMRFYGRLQGLEKDTILDEIQIMRVRSRDNRTLSFKRRERQATRSALDQIFGTGPESRRNLTMTIGGKPSAKKSRSRSGHNDFYVAVGYMWLRKVWGPIYNAGANELPYAILKAEPVRVNNKLMDVYEVKAFDMTTGYSQDGYVAVTKGSRKAFYSQKGSTAITKAMGQITIEIDKLLIGKGTTE